MSTTTKKTESAFAREILTFWIVPYYIFWNSCRLHIAFPKDE